MPRYFFDISNSDGFHRDEYGSECECFADARDQCQDLLPDIAREELPHGELHTISCDVRNEVGRIVYRGRLTYEGTRDPT